MVGVAQRPKASGCGPEYRGFESHHPPQLHFPTAPPAKSPGIRSFYLCVSAQTLEPTTGIEYLVVRNLSAVWYFKI
jgi:hypothetical protein